MDARRGFEPPSRGSARVKVSLPHLAAERALVPRRGLEPLRLRAPELQRLVTGPASSAGNEELDAPRGLEPRPQEPKSSVLPATPRGIIKSLLGCPSRIRTSIDGVRVRSLTIRGTGIKAVMKLDARRLRPNKASFACPVSQEHALTLSLGVSVRGHSGVFILHRSGHVKCYIAAQPNRSVKWLHEPTVSQNVSRYH
jgi:hypothetical protein